MKNPTEQSRKISNHKLVIASLVVLLANTFLIIYHFNKYGASNLNGSYSDTGNTQIMATAFVGVLITIPFFCLLISLLTALFVNSEIPYGARIKRIFWWTLFIVNSLMILSVIIDWIFGM
jgi:magnesium-transporting ATPase (P-type)